MAKKEASAKTPAGNGAASSKPKKGMAKIIVIVVGLLAMAGGGGVAYMLKADDSSEGKKPKHVESHYLALEPFLINLADKEVRRYLKVKMELEVPSEKVAKELEKSLPRLRDACILLLGNQTYNDIASTEGKLKLKQEIMKRVAELPGGQKVSNIFFTEFVAQ